MGTRNARVRQRPRLHPVVSLLLVVLAGVAVAGEPPPDFVWKAGSEGTSDGQFFHAMFPSAVIPNRLYVSDCGSFGSPNNRVQIFDWDGNFVGKLGEFGFSVPGQFRCPGGVAIDTDAGSVYVVDIGNYKIQKFDLDGNFQSWWGYRCGSNDISLSLIRTAAALLSVAMAAPRSSGP